MATGLEIRAQIDAETSRSVVVLNGGGAVALLALLNPIISRPEQYRLVYVIMVGVMVMALHASLARTYCEFALKVPNLTLQPFSGP